MRPKDTSSAAHRVQLDVYRSMSANERLALALDMGDALRAITTAGIRSRHPEYDTASVELAVWQLSLGAKTFRAAFSARKPVAP